MKALKELEPELEKQFRADMKRLGEKVTKLRTQQNQSKKEFAKTCGITVNKLTRIEKGIFYNIDTLTLLHLSEALKIGIPDLFKN